MEAEGNHQVAKPPFVLVPYDISKAANKPLNDTLNDTSSAMSDKPVPLTTENVPDHEFVHVEKYVGDLPDSLDNTGMETDPRKCSHMTPFFKVAISCS